MIKTKGGFTLIEVSLFLAITGLLFLGVTIGVQNSIFQQRYNDSVQNFVEFLRSAYAKTENVQGTQDGGRSNEAIYGKLITFGENGGDEVFMYSVVGKASCGSGFNGTLDALKSCEVDVIKKADSKPYSAESYKPKWSAAIQNTDWKQFEGAILITRHPQSGTVYTFVKKTNGTIEVSQGVGLSNYLNNDNFEPISVDFCINPNGNTDSGGIRADVRIVAGARNSSGIEIMPDKNAENEKTGDYNKCADRG